MDTLTIDPEVFATVVTACVAIFSPIIHRISDRTAETRRRRQIDDATALLGFYRDWNSLNVALAAQTDIDGSVSLKEKLQALERDIAKLWAINPFRPPANTSFLSRVPLPHPADSVLGWLLHTLYYLLVLVFIFDVSSTIIGVATETTLENAFLGLIGGFVYSVIIGTIIVGVRWAANRVDRAAQLRFDSVNDTSAST